MILLNTMSAFRVEGGKNTWAFKCNGLIDSHLAAMTYTECFGPAHQFGVILHHSLQNCCSSAVFLICLVCIALLRSWQSISVWLRTPEGAFSSIEDVLLLIYSSTVSCCPLALPQLLFQLKLVDILHPYIILQNVLINLGTCYFFCRWYQAVQTLRQ